MEQKIKHGSQDSSLGRAATLLVCYTQHTLEEALHFMIFSLSSTLSKISQSHQLSFFPPFPLTEDKINRIRVQKSLSRTWVKAKINPLLFLAIPTRHHMMLTLSPAGHLCESSS